jgi:hypothetical protein
VRRHDVGGGVPYPVFRDGTLYTVPGVAAALPDGTRGVVGWVTWVDADGRPVNRADTNAGAKGARWDALLNTGSRTVNAPLTSLMPATGGTAG